MPRAIDRLLEKGKEEAAEGKDSYGREVRLAYNKDGIVLFKSECSRRVLLNMNRGQEGEIWTVSFYDGTPHLVAAYIGNYPEMVEYTPGIRTIISSTGDFDGNCRPNVVAHYLFCGEKYEQRQAELLEIFERIKKEKK